MRKTTIPLRTDSIGQLLDPSNRNNTKDSAGRDKIVCKNAIKERLREVIILNRTIYDTSLDSLPNYEDIKYKKQQRSLLIEEIWELYCEAKGIEYIKPKDKKKVIDMTAEELEAVLKAVNANRPQVVQTMNFNAPIGQQIAHVDKIEAHFDKDMKMEIAGAEEVAGMPSSEATPKDDDVTNRDTIPASELFRFIHPSVTDYDERVQIHKEVENLVCNNTIPNICVYLNEMSAKKRVLQPLETKIALKELRRMGMPGEDAQGFGEKNFQKYYRK